MSTPKHSPLPWFAIKETIADADGNYVNTDFLANRHLIVTAVNSHAALLAAAKYALEYMSQTGHVQDKLRAAIAAAEEHAT